MSNQINEQKSQEFDEVVEILKNYSNEQLKNVIDILKLVTNEQLSNIVQGTKIEEIIRIADIAFLKYKYLVSMPKEIGVIRKFKNYDGSIGYMPVYHDTSDYEYSVIVNDFKNHLKNDNVRMYDYEITYSYLSTAIVSAFAYMAENCRYVKLEYFVTEEGNEKIVVTW